MTNEQILHEIAALPKLARREVEDFISFLTSRNRPSPDTSLLNEEFIGIWRDRDEFADSTEWVRGVREKHWSN